MRRVVWLLLIVSAAVGIALLLRLSHGNVAILWPPYRIDLSVNLAVLILALIFLLLHLLFGVLSNALNLPGRVREYRERRRREHALTGLRDSLLAFFEGRFGRAERLARGALPDHALAGSAALIAARAAQRMHEPERRDRWLESADLAGDVDGPRRTTIAEMALDEHRPAEALAAIDELKKVRGVRPVHSLRLALRAHEQMEDWHDALIALRQLERRDAIDPALARATRIRALRALFANAGDDPAAVARLWKELPAPEREIDDVAVAAAGALLTAGRQDAAARIVEQVLDNHYQSALVALWPDLNELPGRDRLARAEKWLQRWGEEPALLVALARICAAEGLWGKAEEFLLRAERREPDAVTRTLLGQLCEQLGRSEDAARWYRLATFASLGSGALQLTPRRLSALPEEKVDDASFLPVVPLPGP